MKKNIINDNEAIMLVQEHDEYAKDLLFNKYKYIIDIILKKYDRLIKSFSIEFKEIYSEALYGFSDALNSFNPLKEASLATFISLCVDRRVKKYIKAAMGPKNMFVLNTYSLDYVYDEYGFSLMDTISDNNKYDPLNNMTEEEKANDLYNKIKQQLSQSEQQVFKYMLQGLNYNDIAVLLKKEPKQIDNAIQRVKNKVKMILSNNVKGV